MKAQEKQTVADKDEYRWYSTPWVNNSAVPKHAPNSLPKLGGSGDRILPPTIDLCQLQLSLGILQLDPADRAVIKIADRRDAIQKKAFTNWVNHHLSKRNCWVHDLFVDLRNGYLLVRLLESLTNELLGFEFIESRLHWIQNVQRVLNFLRYRGIRIVNIRADEIVDGNPKLTLGLIWIIILHFQVTEVLQNQTGVSVSLNTNVPVDEVAKQSLLNWCRAVTTGYPGVFVRDFSTSWLDGRGFLTLIHRYRPELVDFHVVDRQSPAQNLELAFTLAERELHVVRLFDAEDLASTTDERSIITYIASLYEALATDSPSIPPLPALYRESVLEPVSLSHGSVVGHLPSDQSSALRTQWLEYRSLATELAQWLRLTTDRMNARNFPPDLKGVEQRVMGEIKRHRLEERPRRERERQQLIRMSEDLKPGIRAGHIPNDPFLRIEQINRLWDEYNTALEERELAALSDMRRLDRLQWAADRIVRECRAVESQLTALERRLVETEPSVTTMVDSQRGGRLCRWSEQLGALETKLNGLFNQVQHLRSGRYVHTEQIYRDVCTLHQRFLDLQRRLRQQSNPSEPNGTKALNSSQVNLSHPAYLPKGLAPGCQDQRYEFLTPIQRCLVWIDDHVNLVKDGSYGNSIQSVEAACRKHEQTIREVAYFRNEIERCRKSQLKATRTPEEKKLSEESMQTLDHAYQQLLEMCDHRTRLSHSLLDFVRRATHQLDWLRAHEASEVHRDWSRPDQLNSGEIRRTLQELVKELKLREPGFSDLSVAGTSMQLDNHPASDLIQAYVIALERHWAWLVQLIGCSESRLEQLMRQESHTSQVAECESILTTQLHDMQLLLGRSCKRSSTMEVDRLRTQLQHIATQLNDYESLINGLMVEAQDIVPLSVDIDESASPGSSLDHRHIGSRVRPLCCFRSADYWFDKPNTTYESVMGETFWPKGSDAAEFDKGDALVLVGTTDTKMSNLRTATGTCLQTPIVCFLPSWPCAEAIERTRYLMNFLNKVKSCLTLADLSLRGEVLCACMNAWRDGDTNQPFTVEGFEEAKRIYVDGLRHSLALRLANQPSDEIERFETELARFDNLLTSTSVPPDQTESVAYSELRQVMGQLRRAVNTLASQLQQRCASSLPDRISELERRIQEHKAWVKDLAHIQSRSLEFQQKLQRSENLTLDGQASPIIIQAQALGDTASQLHVAGQAYSQLLADTDAWLARLNRADEVLGECELSLLGSAIHIHGLFPSLGTLEPANHDGLRAESVERAHKDLKAIAERLPRVRAELDLLSQQVPDVNKLTLSENRDPHVTREFLRLLLPVDNQVLLPRLNICHQRLAAAMREVELELKAFGDSLRCFPTYQSLHDDLLHQSTEFKNRIVELSELVRSIGLESGSDETLIKAALGQADQIAAEVDDQLVKVEQLNRHIAQMILVLTNYAKATQNYRQLVETTFQQSGASRDYRWSPGFGLFDITQILRNADQITDRYNDHAQQVYDQIQCLYNVLRHSGYGGHLQLTHVPRALTYRQIYPGEFPPEFPQRRSITPDQAFRPGSTPSIPVSLRTSGSRLPITDYTYVNGEHQTNWELRLDCIETESVVALPNGWDFPPDLNTDRAFWSRLKKPMPTSGAWFVTRLSEFDSEGCRDEPLCIGDALRRGLIDPRSQTCQPSSKASSMSISWKEAVERGWLTDQASRALSDPIRTPRGLYCPLASLILRPGEFNQTDGVDPATGNYWPEQQKLVELWMESKLSSSDFTRLAAVLSSGIAVEYRESRVCWCDASCEKQSPSMVKPCLSDWLSAGAYNPATRRLRVSILKDNSTANMEKKLFCEDELTIKQCIELGLIDPHMPEVIVPMETSSESARTTPYRRITLNTAISVGLIDDVDGLWCGISQWADVSVSLHVAHTAGLISRAPSLSEALLAGLLALDRVDENGQLRSGLVDTHTGSHMSFSEAIQRGLVQGNCPSLMLLRASHVKTHSLTEALRLGIINELGEFQLHNGSSVTLWDAVNSGLVRLVHTQVYPPPVGVLQPKLARKQQYHQHPVLQAIRTNLLDAGSEEILLSEAEAKQHGLSPTMRRILLRKSPRISHLCDVQTVNLLTRSSGLIYPDGRELTGLEALARGWLIPCSSSPPGSRQYGQVIDPTTDLAVDVVAGTTWPPTRPLSTNGAHLLLGLSSHRPYRGYLMIQRLITKLSWLGPGLHDDNLVKPTLLTNLPRVPSSTSLGHQWRPEQILSVLDPSSARHLSPSEAIRRNLLDLDSGVFRFPDTGRTISLGDAVGQKLVQVSRSKPPTATSHTDANTPDSLSITETRTYRILSVMDPATGQLINPDRAIATGLLNLNERMYMGTQPSISIDEAMNRGFVLAHGTTPVIFNSDVLLNGEPRKTVKEMNLPLTLTELIATGHIVQDSDKSCMVRVPNEPTCITVNEAVAMGILDAEHSLLRSMSTNSWTTLAEALCTNQMDGISGYVNLQPGWISILDAASRGLLSETASAEGGRVSFDEALARGLIDPVSSRFYRPNQSDSGVPSSVSIKEAIDRGWLEPPIELK
ncbi:plectin, partial [Clonorchis sinensis]